MSNTISATESDFRFSPSELEKVVAQWQTKGWPIEFLQSDHLSAKLFQDNNIFNLIKFYKHEWKWDDQEGLLVLHKKSSQSSSVFSPWNELLSGVKYKAVTKKDGVVFLMDGCGLIYGEEGFERDTSFQYSSTEFKSVLATFVKQGWPVQFLLRDHYGAKVMYDNCVFQFMDFYGHQWKWDESNGLLLLFQSNANSIIEYTPWKDIIATVPIQVTPQGWLLFDGWTYTHKGLIPVHLWQWQHLHAAYQYPSEHVPDVCYVDIVSYNWEHEGMPGFGMVGGPHGHLAVEFGDDLGTVYSVGMYMDPRAKINTKQAPAATVKACLMAPDPYFASRGEKSFHRYSVGRGPAGRENIARLKQWLEQVQSYRKNPGTGVVTTCPRKYHTFANNCGVFLQEIEAFTKTQLGGQLVKIDENTVLLPTRTRVQHAKQSWAAETRSKFWNVVILFMVDLLVWVMVTTPGISKKLGVGTEDEDVKLLTAQQDGESPVKISALQQHLQQQPRRKLGSVVLFFGGMLSRLQMMLQSLKPKRVLFPRRVRYQQLYSPQLKQYAAKVKS